MTLTIKPNAEPNATDQRDFFLLHILALSNPKTYHKGMNESHAQL